MSIARTVPIKDFGLQLISLKGVNYVYGAEADPNNGHPSAVDCSEAMQWASTRSGLHLPDGAFNQWVYCKNDGGSISVAAGMRTYGALLFAGSGKGTGRGAISHVVMSLGDGTDFEARGKAYGVGVWPSDKRFQFACLIPGAIYGLAPVVPRAEVPRSHPVLRQGATGVEVKYLQTVLAAHGFKGVRGAAIKADGAFGKNTTAAVKSLQVWAHLKNDGIVGPATWRSVDMLAR